MCPYLLVEPGMVMALPSMHWTRHAENFLLPSFPPC
jgi:hypothetical protein